MKGDTQKHKRAQLKRLPSIPCCRAARAGRACTPSSRSSSWAPCAWWGFCGGTWAGSAPSSARAARGLWTAPVWSSASDAAAEQGREERAQEVRTRRREGGSPTEIKSPLHVLGSGPSPRRSDPERFVSVRRSRTRMENIFMGRECSRRATPGCEVLTRCGSSGSIWRLRTHCRQKLPKSFVYNFDELIIVSTSGQGHFPKFIAFTQHFKMLCGMCP